MSEDDDDGEPFVPIDVLDFSVLEGSLERDVAELTLLDVRNLAESDSE